MHYFTVVLLLAVFLAAELNPFYLKVCPLDFMTRKATLNPSRTPTRHSYGWNPTIRL